MAIDRSEWQFSLAGLLGTTTALCVLFALTGEYGAYFLVALVCCSACGVAVGGTISAIRRCLEAFWDRAGITAEDGYECHFSSHLPPCLINWNDLPPLDDEMLARIADDLFLEYDREEEAAKSHI